MKTANTATRNTVRLILMRSGQWDHASMQIGRDGIVSAKKDANKTANPTDTVRYRIGHITDVIAEAGQ